MIVITSLSRASYYLSKDDEFHLTVTDRMGAKIIIREIIKVTKEINFVASYRFALEDGSCPNFHLCGIFANSAELPKEIQEAKMLEDLSKKQYEKFVKTVGIEIKKKGGHHGENNGIHPGQHQ